MDLKIGMFYAGIDLGSTMTKVVIVDESLNSVASVTRPTGAEHRRLAGTVTRMALDKADLEIDRIAYIVTTGYGRFNVPFADRQITELTCHTRGLVSLFPDVKTGIDIGGQDAKGLNIRNGRLVDFVMNDRCAAGTGRFLELMAETLGLNVSDLGPLSLQSTQKIAISSTCTIFAQDEVVSRLSEGIPAADIIAGVHNAVASLTVKMLGKMRVEPPVVFTGGVAKNSGVIKALEEKLGYKIIVPAEPLLTGALGAAILARETFIKSAGTEITALKERHLTD